MKWMSERCLALLGTVFAIASLAVALVALDAMTPSASSARPCSSDKPTVVLVHGAFAESSSWNAVIWRLRAEGYPVIAAANPLRGVESDANYVAGLIDSIQGPVILVGHSYGGLVISNAALGKRNVKALVYVAAFAPEAGESAFTLSTKFPGSTLGAALAPPVPLADGSNDLYIQQERFAEQFAADLPLSEARIMAVSQRPVTDAALNEAAGTPAWKTIPAWFFYGTQDKNIPAAVQAFMAERAHAQKVVVIRGASHVVMISRPDALVRLLNDAHAATCQRP